MIHLAKVQLLIVWACLHIITHVKGNVMSERSFDEKLIVVIPSVGYFTKLNVVNSCIHLY